MLTCGLAAAVLAAAPPAADPGGASEGLRVGSNLRINLPQLTSHEGQLGREGMAVAASADGQRILAGWDDVRGMCGPPMGRSCKPQSPPGLAGIGYSVDGGQSWTEIGAPPPAGGFMSGGHVWIDRGGTDNQTFFVVSRGRKIDDASPRGRRGILFNRGRFENGAFVWQDSRYLATFQPEDEWRGPSLAAAKDGSGRVYVVLSSLHWFCGRQGTGAGEIDLLRSSDGGSTWETPVVIGPDETFETRVPAGDPACAARGWPQATPTIALGSGGEVDVVWQYGPVYQVERDPLNLVTAPTASFRFASSLNGGRTFSEPRVLVTVNSLAEDPPVGLSKDFMLDTPRLAVALDGPHRGRIYVAFAVAVREVRCGSFIFGPKIYSPVSSQVYILWSDDRGESWSHPAPLGPPVPATGIKRFFPAVAVGPGGEVDAVYFESREMPVTSGAGGGECIALLNSGYFRRAARRSLVDLWWARSRDGGGAFGPRQRVTSETADWCDALYDHAGALFSNFGDFVGIFATASRTFVVWADGRHGVPDSYFAALEGAAR